MFPMKECLTLTEHEHKQVLILLGKYISGSNNGQYSVWAPVEMRSVLHRSTRAQDFQRRKSEQINYQSNPDNNSTFNSKNILWNILFCVLCECKILNPWCTDCTIIITREQSKFDSYKYLHVQNKKQLVCSSENPPPKSTSNPGKCVFNYQPQDCSRRKGGGGGGYVWLIYLVHCASFTQINSLKASRKHFSHLRDIYPKAFNVTQQIVWRV